MEIKGVPVLKIVMNLFMMYALNVIKIIILIKRIINVKIKLEYLNIAKSLSMVKLVIFVMIIIILMKMENV